VVWRGADSSPPTHHRQKRKDPPLVLSHQKRFPFPFPPQLATASASATLAAYHALVADVRSTPAYAALIESVLLPLLRTLDPELAHNLGIRAARLGLLPVDHLADDERRAARLGVDVLGLRFRSPVGLAAGFDKQAEAMPGLLASGFAFVEVGTVTPRPQPGNPTPRMFRLTEDRAVINRFGFNSDGLNVVAERLEHYWAPLLASSNVSPGVQGGGSTTASSSSRPPRGVVGVNVGKNKEGDAVEDYTRGVSALSPLADYVTVNISSPNTPGLRALQGREQLRGLLRAAVAARDAIPWGAAASSPSPSPSPSASSSLPSPSRSLVAARAVAARPSRPALLVKIAPDLTEADLADIAAVVLESKGGVDGIIVTNTTVARPSTLRSSPDLVAQTGGLSGQPVFEPSTAVLRRLYELTGGAVPLVGVGGISSPEQAYTKIKAGASLVQLYTALAYEGEAARGEARIACLLACRSGGGAGPPLHRAHDAPLLFIPPPSPLTSPHPTPTRAQAPRSRPASTPASSTSSTATASSTSRRRWGRTSRASQRGRGRPPGSEGACGGM
jgi:dihydroorotate dehydrogenase